MSPSLRHTYFRIVFPLVLLIASFVAMAEGPAWWTTRHVIIPGQPADDFAALNQGQLKHMAGSAYNEMEAKLTGGAGTDIQAMFASWQAEPGDDFAAVNLGQLKATALPFHQRLLAAGQIEELPAWALVPGTDNLNVVNIGQAKALFAFEVHAPPGGEGEEGSGVIIGGSGSIPPSPYTYDLFNTSSSVDLSRPAAADYGLKYVVTPQNPTWSSEISINVALGAVGQTVLASPFRNPRNIVASDHWVAMQVDDVEPEQSKGCVILYKRASPSHPWKIDRSTAVSVRINLPTIRKAVQTNFGMKLALHETDSGVATLAIVAARDDAPNVPCTIDMWRSSSLTSGWAADVAGQKAIAASNRALEKGNSLNANLIGASQPIPEFDHKKDYIYQNLEGFGASIVVCGNWLYVGAPKSTLFGRLQRLIPFTLNETGAVVCFKRTSASTWTYQRTINPSFPIYGPNDNGIPVRKITFPTAQYRFGSALAISDRFVAAAAVAYEQPERLVDAAVYVGTHDVQVGPGVLKRLVEPLLSPELRVRAFGHSLLWANDMLVVGSPIPDDVNVSTTASGRIYGFAPDGTGWKHTPMVPLEQEGQRMIGFQTGIAQGRIWTVTGSSTAAVNRKVITFPFETYASVNRTVQVTDLTFGETLTFSHSPQMDAKKLSASHEWTGEMSYDLRMLAQPQPNSTPDTDDDQAGDTTGTLRHGTRVDTGAPVGTRLFTLDFDTPVKSCVITVPVASGVPASVISGSFSTHATSPSGKVWGVFTAKSGANSAVVQLKPGLTLLNCRVDPSAAGLATYDIPLALFKSPTIPPTGVLTLERFEPTDAQFGTWKTMIESYLITWRRMGFIIMEWKDKIPWRGGIPAEGMRYRLEATGDAPAVTTRQWHVVADHMAAYSYSYPPQRTLFNDGNARKLYFRVHLVDIGGSVRSTSNEYYEAWDTDGDRLPDWFETQVTGTSKFDTDDDNDGIPDGEEDDDLDGLNSGNEYANGTDPKSSDISGNPTHYILEQVSSYAFSEAGMPELSFLSYAPNTTKSKRNINENEKEYWGKYEERYKQDGPVIFERYDSGVYNKGKTGDDFWKHMEELRSESPKLRQLAVLGVENVPGRPDTIAYSGFESAANSTFNQSLDPKPSRDSMDRTVESTNCLTIRAPSNLATTTEMTVVVVEKRWEKSAGDLDGSLPALPPVGVAPTQPPIFWFLKCRFVPGQCGGHPTQIFSATGGSLKGAPFEIVNINGIIPSSGKAVRLLPRAQKYAVREVMMIPLPVEIKDITGQFGSTGKVILTSPQKQDAPTEASIAWIDPHGAIGDSALMPQLEASIPLGPSSIDIEWALEVDYDRGNGMRKNLHQVEDKVYVPHGGFTKKKGNESWKMFNEHRWQTELNVSGLFGGDAVITMRIGGYEERLHFRIGGRSPENDIVRTYIDSQTREHTVGAITIDEKRFSYAIAKHETAEYRYNGKFYNQFRNNPVKANYGLPTWNLEEGPGGYGVFQITGSPTSGDDNIPRAQIWGWQENVDAYFAIMRHTYKFDLAKRFYDDIKNDSAHHTQAFNACPPPNITIGNHIFSSDEAIWITAYNGWKGTVKSRYLFDPDLPCGVTYGPSGHTKRWYWNPRNNPDEPYINMFERQME